MNFVKNFKTKSPKAFWTIIVVVVALVVVGFANNNNNGTPFSFSKTPQKMIEDGGSDKIWKLSSNGSNIMYIKFGEDNKVYGGGSKDEISTKDPAKYTFNDNDSLDIKAPDSSGDSLEMDLKNLKVDNNKIKGNIKLVNDGKSINADVTLTPVD